MQADNVYMGGEPHMSLSKCKNLYFSGTVCEEILILAKLPSGFSESVFSVWNRVIHMSTEEKG